MTLGIESHSDGLFLEVWAELKESTQIVIHLGLKRVAVIIIDLKSHGKSVFGTWWEWEPWRIGILLRAEAKMDTAAVKSQYWSSEGAREEVPLLPSDLLVMPPHPYPLPSAGCIQLGARRERSSGDTICSSSPWVTDGKRRVEHECHGWISYRTPGEGLFVPSTHN